MPPYANRPRRHLTYVRQRSDQLQSRLKQAMRMPTQAPRPPLAKKPSHKRTDAFQIVKRAQPGRNDPGYRAASGPRWSDIGGVIVGATACLLETPPLISS